MAETSRSSPYLRFDFTGEETVSSPVVFTDPVEIVVAREIAEVSTALNRIEEQVRSGSYAAGFLTYEAAPAFDSAYRVHPPGPLPLLWFGIFETPTAPAPDCPDSVEPTDATEWTPDCSRIAYDRAITTIREAIRAGESYQINYTFRLHAHLTGNDWNGYRDLLRAQRPGFGAYLDIGSHRILSTSPELFFRRRGAEIETRPMKGTRPRGRWGAEDELRARELRESEKELAENRMIVDLLRNDLGRIATYGSVSAPRLFEIERYPTVLQMTSTVTASTQTPASLTELLTALFPCGSVTGAPKISTMAWIERLESGPRGVYCGAIGFVRPGGDCTFNVPIRTLTLDVDSGRAEYGVGGGITFDSTADAEYDEAMAKARVLRTRIPDFEIVETVRIDDGEAIRIDRHRARMEESADYFGFPFDRAETDHRIRSALRAYGEGSYTMRILLSDDGTLRTEWSPVTRPTEENSSDGLREGARTFALSTDPVDASDPFLFHKTTHRSVYDIRRARHPEQDDVLLINRDRELTEFTIGNLVVEADGGRWTPPRECGLLAGVFRGWLLETGQIEERVLHPEILERATGIWLVNSVREWVRVVRTG